jgi:hypothetical protein
MFPGQALELIREIDMFAFKKILSACLMPVPLVTAILVIGVCRLWFTKRETFGKSLVTAGTLLMVLPGYGPVSESLLRGLEKRRGAGLEKSLFPQASTN